MQMQGIGVAKSQDGKGGNGVIIGGFIDSGALAFCT